MLSLTHSFFFPLVLVSTPFFPIFMGVMSKQTGESGAAPFSRLFGYVTVPLVVWDLDWAVLNAVAWRGRGGVKGCGVDNVP